MLPFALLCLLFILPLHGSGFLFEIKSSLSEIDPLHDEALEVECYYNSNDPNTDTEKLISVEEIHIIRKDKSGKWTELAKLQANGYLKKIPSDVQVYGNVGPSLNDTFLKLYWEHASKDDLGIYRCDVVVTDVNFMFDVEESNLLTMQEHNSTAEEMFLFSQGQLASLQSDFENYKKKAVKKLATLENSLKELRNESQNQDDKLEDEITKEDLDQLKEDIRESVLANVSAQVEAMTCSRLTSCWSSDVTEAPVSLQSNTEEAEILTTEVDYAQANPSQTTQRTIPDSQDPQLYWPTGKFGLLKPQSGCPETPQDPHWHEGYTKYHTESVEENHDNITGNSQLAEPILEVSDSGKHFFYMHFCVSDNQNPLGEMWPNGSYCINRANSECPANFKSGYMDIDEEDTDFGGSSFGALPDMLYFCCRGDGSPETPISLPNSAPFYLYRFGGKCQEVDRMDVRPETMLFDTENEHNQDDYENDVHPDGKLEDVEIELCYYYN